MTPPFQSSISNKPAIRSPGQHWLKQFELWKQEKEKVELVTIIVNGMAQKTSLSIDSNTHSKIVLKNETIKQLVSYAKRGNEYTYTESTFDDIIQSLLRRRTKQLK